MAAQSLLHKHQPCLQLLHYLTNRPHCHPPPLLPRQTLSRLPDRHKPLHHRLHFLHILLTHILVIISLPITASIPDSLLQARKVFPIKAEVEVRRVEVIAVRALVGKCLILAELAFGRLGCIGGAGFEGTEV